MDAPAYYELQNPTSPEEEGESVQPDIGDALLVVLLCVFVAGYMLRRPWRWGIIR